MEKTFLMVKPDGVQRAFIGEIVARFEKKGFQLVGAKLMQVTPEIAEQHYGEHKERPFFGELVDFITSGPVFAMVWQGEDVVDTARNMMGKTRPHEAAPGNNSWRFRCNCCEKHYPRFGFFRKCRARDCYFL